MAVVPIRRILDTAFAERYGVAAINVVDDLSLEAVLAAATELDSPLIVQTSLKTVKSIGAKALYSMWRQRADEAPVPGSQYNMMLSSSASVVKSPSGSPLQSDQT